MDYLSISYLTLRQVTNNLSCSTVDVASIMRAKRAGAEGYLLKPFNRAQLLESFRSLTTAA